MSSKWCQQCGSTHTGQHKAPKDPCKRTSEGWCKGCGMTPCARRPK